MAKLSAHGTEIARVTIRRVALDGRDFDLETGEWVENLESRFDFHYSFRSDGHILRRIVGLDVHRSYPEGPRRRADWGWKLYRKFDHCDVDVIRAAADRMRAAAEARGDLV